MPSGGRRTGTPGVQYPNRTDLPNAVGPSEQYGERVAQERALRAVPIGAPSGQPALAENGPGAGGVVESLPAVDAPTGRPSEPLTAGAPVGPGPGPEALRLPAGDDPELDILRAVYRLHPNEDLRELIEDAETGAL